MALTVSYTREGDIHYINTGNSVLQTITVDNTGIPEAERAGTAKQLLASSALFCYCTALAGVMEARKIPYENLKAEAILDVGPNELGQGRVRQIQLRVSFTVPKAFQQRMETIKRIMSSGCLVTSSLHDGIAMQYDLEPSFTE